MNHFKTPLLTETVDDSTDRLIAPLIFHSDKHGDIEVPAGFETDYASVPRIPLAFMLFGGKAKKASVPHDYLYQTGLKPRDVADDIFLEAMEATSVPWWRRRLMYLAVVEFGWTSYKGAAA